jgi:hypothetical protein
LLSLLPSALVLGLVALVALALTRTRCSPPERAAERLRASRALALAVVVQSVHFVEEAATGFNERVPALVGLPPMPQWFFIAFNLAWIVAWVASVPGVRAAHAGAFFASWFLAIAGMANGVLHPLLAAVSGGYFPGLWTSPAIGAASVWLWRRLRAATEV